MQRTRGISLTPKIVRDVASITMLAFNEKSELEARRQASSYPIGSDGQKFWERVAVQIMENNTPLEVIPAGWEERKTLMNPAHAAPYGQGNSNG